VVSIIKAGDTTVIAANNPEDPAVIEEAKKYIKAEKFEMRVALTEDIQWYIQDFLHAKPGLLIGRKGPALHTGAILWRIGERGSHVTGQILPAQGPTLRFSGGAWSYCNIRRTYPPRISTNRFYIFTGS